LHEKVQVRDDRSPQAPGVIQSHRLTGIFTVRRYHFFASEGNKSMNGTDVGSITVSFAMNENEYARYAAAIKRRQPRWANFLAFVLVLFSAIPVALTFRFFARQSYVAAISDEIGLVSLLSYMVGAYAMMTAAFVIQRRTSKRTVAAVRAYGTVTAVLDVAGVALTR
jgi:hypothetical protein